MNKSPPTLLEDALSAVLHSYLCGSSLEEAMEGFYRKHSPSFQGFDFGSAEFSLLQKLAHEEYINTLEQLLGNRLSDFGCSWDRFEDVFEVSLNEEKEGSEGLEAAIIRAHNFAHFGEMMRSKYESMYKGNGAKGAKGESPTRSGDNENKSTIRIFWDIENVQVPKGWNSFEFASSLIDYCKARVSKEFATASLESSKASISYFDCLCCCFYCPLRHTVKEVDMKRLDRAGVEQILALGKREDADRKMANRIVRESNQLSHCASSTHFVLVTSDCDFVAHMQNLTNQGFKVGNLNVAASKQQSEALRNSCDWSEHISVLKNRACGGEEAEHQHAEEEDEEEDEEEEDEDEDEEEEDNNRRGWNRNEESTDAATDAATDAWLKLINKAQMADVDITAKFTGFCRWWNAEKRYGFVIPDNFEYRVFCHLNEFKEEHVGGLKPGDRVSFFIHKTGRGPVAKDVQLLYNHKKGGGSAKKKKKKAKNG